MTNRMKEEILLQSIQETVFCECSGVQIIRNKQLNNIFSDNEKDEVGITF